MEKKPRAIRVKRPEKKPSVTDRVIKQLELNPKQVGWIKVVAVGLAVGILLLQANSLFGLTDDSKRPKGATEVSGTPSVATSPDELAQLQRDLEHNLEGILAKMKGAGGVSVAIALKSGQIVTPVTDTRKQTTTTNEKTTEGSSRAQTTTEEDVTNVVAKGTGVSGDLAVMKRSRAEIAGVLIVADGARSQAVKGLLFQAARTALGVSPELIQVVAAEGR
ncbi:MAG TPA: hypothetical protein VGK74_21550 [Symbiobacteriaceae bacterium]